MKTFRYDDHIIEYEDDVVFNGNEYIRTIENTKCCEIQTNGNVKVSEEITKQSVEATKRTDNYAAMCNSDLAASIGRILIAVAAGLTAYKATSFMTQQNPQNPEEKKE